MEIFLGLTQYKLEIAQHGSSILHSLHLTKECNTDTKEYFIEQILWTFQDCFRQTVGTSLLSPTHSSPTKALKTECMSTPKLIMCSNTKFIMTGHCSQQLQSLQYLGNYSRKTISTKSLEYILISDQ